MPRVAKRLRRTLPWVAEDGPPFGAVYSHHRLPEPVDGQEAEDHVREFLWEVFPQFGIHEPGAG